MKDEVFGSETGGGSGFKVERGAVERMRRKRVK